jgi:hypothetical protein
MVRSVLKNRANDCSTNGLGNGNEYFNSTGFPPLITVLLAALSM